MSFPRYERYKDSGVEWLGEVPEHWGISPLKSFTKFSGGGTPSRDKPEYWVGNIPWVSPKDMKQEKLFGAEECISEEGLESSAASLVPEGTVIMVVRSGILQHTIPVAINAVPVALNQDMKAFRFDERKFKASFFLRWVQGLNDSLLLAWAKQGATVESIEHSLLANSLVPLPPLIEQNVISGFLDHELGKIDALIEEQRRLIALLKEKRQAVISHAVTKGLDHTSAMKESGLEWLGRVPKHWAMVRLKDVCRQGDGIQMGPFGGMLLGLATEDTGFRVYGQQNTIAGDFGIVTRWLSKERFHALEPYKLSAGDIVLTRKGSLGSARLVGTDVGPGVIDSDTIRVRVREDCATPLFISFLFHEAAYIATQISMVKRGAILSGLNSTNIANLILALPDKSEQEHMMQALSQQTKAFDSTLDEVNQGISLLQERRSALISAVVTGKIDIRNYASSERSAEELNELA